MIDRGLRIRHLGESWFSWSDLLALVHHKLCKPGAALHDEIYPEYESADTLLARYTAQAVADMRWLAAVRYADDQGDLPDILERFGYVTFAGLGEDNSSQNDAADDEPDRSLDATLDRLVGLN